MQKILEKILIVAYYNINDINNIIKNSSNEEET